MIIFVQTNILELLLAKGWVTLFQGNKFYIPIRLNKMSTFFLHPHLKSLFQCEATRREPPTQFRCSRDAPGATSCRNIWIPKGRLGTVRKLE